ncbi:MAG: leucine--tRNA ligase [Patescibacteria group bacterium]
MYPHQSIEKKWQEVWEKNKAFEVSEDPEKKKFYCLDMFPYPSSNGLHVGHPEGYTATDIYSRYLRMNGYNVLHPMGWDAFGLPAENFAIKQGVHPATTTAKNIENFRKQIKSFGFSYDWSREVDTSSPEYYKWTQWIFLQLYKKGLAYKRKARVNWCTSCQTVLANEQVVNASCDRCHSEVIQKELEQWFLKVTDYADELLSCLDTLDWPNSIKASQRNWIGKSEGLIFSAPVKDTDMALETFSAHFEACYADSFVVIAPDHPLLSTLLEGVPRKDHILNLAQQMINERALTREEREPTGIFTERWIINPLDGKELPIWIASFALADYGTGIVKCSAHDQRDFVFAKKYGIPLKVCLVPQDQTERERVERFEYCYSDMQNGILTEPAEAAGKQGRECRQLIIDHCEQNGFAQTSTTYKLRDWLISRQRYWGAPIPILYCDSCGEQGVPEIDLPVLLPTDVDFRPTGESPLTRSKEFHSVKCPSCGGSARRESDTMDTFMCSSWYYLRYTSPRETNQPFDKEKIQYWMPVDMYVGGAEHAVLHLLYARFMTKALRDCGFLSFDEPFTRLRNQGLILGEDGEKMSKSRGNVINPDDVVGMFGADTIRIYEMFMGPFEAVKPWSTNGAVGVRRFLERVWYIFDQIRKHPDLHTHTSSHELQKGVHKTVKKVTEDIVTFNFNTAVSSMMICVNALHDAIHKEEVIDKELQLRLLLILAPFAPHIVEELLELCGAEPISTHTWPTYDSELVKDSVVTVVIQVDGRVRDQIEVEVDCAEDMLKAHTFDRPAVQKWIEGKDIKKIIVVKNKLVNIVLES